ncbi:MAG: hypothetical protein HS104_20615 [Polyangiaceae bacterium]|nr:hypothetical protein [Polyangiaceae bacterium]MCL4756566.1 hypothetical protein [Myxococcales bacterium]
MKHQWAQLLLGTFGTVLLACSELGEPAGNAAEKKSQTPAPATLVVVTVTPADLLSATGTTPIVFWFDYGDRAVPGSVLDAVKKTIQLEEFPSGKPVAFSVQEQPSPAVSVPSDSTQPKGSSPAPRAPVVVTSNPQRASLTVVPVEDLSNTWHRVSFDAKSAGVTTMRTMNPTSPDGRSGSRFNPGNAPSLQSVTSCAGPPGSNKVVLRFSEPVRTEKQSDIAVTWGVSPTCTSNSEPGTDARTMFGFSCAAAGAPVTLQIGIGTLKGVDGQLASVFGPSGQANAFVSAPLQQLIDMTQAFESEALCRTWVP